MKGNVKASARRSIILLSGGLDSTVNFKRSVDRDEAGLVLTFDYGQRSARREIAVARAMARRCGVPFRTMKLDWLAKATHTALVDRHKRLPHPHLQDLDDTARAATRAARAVWVPNRNAVFIAITAALAEGMGCGQIVVGFNAEEAATFPDNSRAFLTAANRALKLSTLAGVRVICYTTDLNKVEIVRLGRKIGAPLDLVWSCYEGGRAMCWRCESCLRFRRALAASGNWEWYRSLRRRD
jgi:7-cyano-7-deazaguanine synthase